MTKRSLKGTSLALIYSTKLKNLDDCSSKNAISGFIGVVISADKGLLIRDMTAWGKFLVSDIRYVDFEYPRVEFYTGLVT